MLFRVFFQGRGLHQDAIRLQVTVPGTDGDEYRTPPHFAAVVMMHHALIVRLKSGWYSASLSPKPPSCVY